jgi:hypothetical protein
LAEPPDQRRRNERGNRRDREEREVSFQIIDLRLAELDPALLQNPVLRGLLQ